jgi:KDO2-lipid IV(A) lauroyltransferase
MDEGHGVIIVSGHLSNFPLAMCDMALRGIPLAVVVRAKGFGPTEKMSQIIRDASGIETIAREATALRTGKWLHHGGVVWLTIDQNSPDGPLVDFFGKPATTFTLAVRMARATGAPILPLFVHTKEDGTYVLEVEEPVRLPRGKPGPAELVNELRQLNVLLEKHILQSPDQWLWAHTRWKTADRMAKQQTA